MNPFLHGLSIPAALGPLARTLLIWLAAATGLIAAGYAAPSRPWAIPLAVFVSVVTCTSLALRSRSLDTLLRDLGLRLIVAFHVVRLVGAFFLWAYAHGQLPAAFAYRAGLGDLAAAVGALVILQLRPGAAFRRAVWIWNIIGALDLLTAFGTAVYLNLTAPGSMDTMATLPWALIPLVAVPLLLATHAKIFQWLWASDRPLPGEEAAR